MDLERSETDRDDVLRLVQSSAMKKLPLVHIPNRAVREGLFKDACAVSAEAMNGDFIVHFLLAQFCA